MSELSNIHKTIEMAKRVGLSRDFAIKVFYIGLRTATGSGYMSSVDMVQIACAIKYAGENKHLLIDPRFRL